MRELMLGWGHRDRSNATWLSCSLIEKAVGVVVLLPFTLPPPLLPLLLLLLPLLLLLLPLPLLLLLPPPLLLLLPGSAADCINTPSSAFANASVSTYRNSVQ